VDDLENKIIHTLTDRGPLTGAELLAALRPIDQFVLWQNCFRSPTLQITSFASYYIRYDVGRENMLRLSPSILRDFLTFTLIALPHQRDALHRKQLTLCNNHRDTSYRKIRIAMEVLSELDGKVDPQAMSSLAAFVAGDICYFMGHDEERPNASGKNMSGSDIDIIIVHEDDANPDELKKIDKHLFERKGILMKLPNYRQEIDYVIKPVSRLKKQLGYGTIDEKIACKIVYESLFIWGSTPFYLKIRRLLETSGVNEMITSDFSKSIEERSAAVKELLNSNMSDISPEVMKLFFATQERVEFS